MIKVLITCAGSGVGQSVTDSLKFAKHQYYLVGADQTRYCYAAPDCDAFVALPSIYSRTYVDELLRLCEEMGVNIVIPGHDHELALLAAHSRLFGERGVQVVVGSAPLVHLLRDKLEWSKAFRERCRCVVATCSVAEFRRGENTEGIYFPAICKPLGGSASTGLTIVDSSNEVLGLPEQYVIQPFLFPVKEDPDFATIREAVANKKVPQHSEISVQLIFAADGELLGRFASRNRLKSGVPVEIIPIDSEVVWSAVDDVFTILSEYEPRGPVNLQGRITDNGLVFFEMNPRFTGITGNRAQFGFNEVRLLVDNFAYGTKRELFINQSRVGVRQVASRTWPRQRYEFRGGTVRKRERHSVLVLGGTSWFARHFVFARAVIGDSVNVVSREMSVGAAEDIYGSLDGVRVFGAESACLPDVFASADVLVNFVAGRPPHGVSAIVDAYRYQMRMFDLVESGMIAKVVNVSSQSVYSRNAGDARNEEAELDLTQPYAFSKYSIEETIRSLARRNASVSAASLRVARLFGPASGLRESEFPHLVVANAVENREVEVHRGGDVLELLDLRDAVRAVSVFVDDQVHHWRGEVFNVGSGEPITIESYVAVADRLCRTRYDRPIRVRTSRTEERGNCSGLDCSKLARLGWSPAYALEQSVEELFEYFSDVRF